MLRTELETQITNCLHRLGQDGHSKEVIDTNKWVTRHFAEYCKEKQYYRITFDVIAEFLKYKYAIDVFSKLCASQMAIRRPLLILWEFYRTGTYLKSHLYEQTSVPAIYNGLYLEFCNHINSLALNVSTKSAKVRYAKIFLSYLEKVEIFNISKLTKDHVSQYINSKSGMTYSTKQAIAYNLRGMLNWLHSNNRINFSGLHNQQPYITRLMQSIT